MGKKLQNFQLSTFNDITQKETKHKFICKIICFY